MRKHIATLTVLALGLMGPAFARASDVCTSTANIVANCGFETGTFASWSLTGNSTDVANSGVDNTAPHSGLYEAYLGAYYGTPALTLSQTLNTTAGQGYFLTFSLMNDTDPDPAGGYTNAFSANIGSTSLFSESNAAAGGYTTYTEHFTAISSSTSLNFVSLNQLGFFDLDSVSVVATPEPGSLVLLGTGVLTLAGAVRRRLA